MIVVMLARLLTVLRTLALIASLSVAGPIVCFAAIELMLDQVGLLFPVLGTSHRAALDDWFKNREARLTEQSVGLGIVARWPHGKPVALEELVHQPMARACVDSGRWAWSNPARDLAERSERPAWWLPWQGHATLAIEFADGRVMAYRIASGSATWTHSLRVRVAAFGRAVCAREGRLVFSPGSVSRGMLGSATYTFIVQGD